MIKFIRAKSCTKRRGVLDEKGDPVPTPQNMSVDNSMYAEVFEHDREHIKQSIVAGIKAIFVLLGQSDLEKRQDPI